MKYTSLIFLLILPLLSLSQESEQINEKELLSLPLDSLRSYIDHTFDEDIHITHERSKVFLKSSKKQSDLTNTNYAYLFLIMSTDDKQTALKYCDTLIDSTKNLDDGRYPAFAHYMKGEVLYNHHESKKALSELLLANQKITPNTIEYYEHAIKQFIAVIAANTQQHKIAIDYYHESFDYLKNNSFDSYLTTVFGLTESHLALNNLDSVSYYLDIGYARWSKMDDVNRALFKLSSGRLSYKKGNYIKAKEILKENYLELKKNKDLANLAICSYWLGGCEEKLSGMDNAIPYYIQVDSIFNINQSVPLELRPSWTKLVDHYRQIGEPIKELQFSRKLIEVDSILDIEYNFITENITNSYVLPSIEKENQKEKDSLEKQLKLNSFWMIGLASVLICSIVFFILYRKSEIKKFNKYKKVIERLEENKSTGTLKVKKPILTKEKISEIEKILETFENSQAFLDPKTNQNRMAAQYKTNPKYLSTYINKYKEISFPEYLNNLRIEYVLNRLSKSFENREDRFRIWSMTEVAKAAGFRSREYYSKAFFKYTNMKHLDYVRQLEKAHKKSSNS